MLLSHLNLLATAPGGVARLRELILTLAVQGKLVPQDPSDEPASALLKEIRAEKDRLIAEGKIKRNKPLAEIAEEEKPFGLPKGWEWVRLNSLLQKIGAGSTPLGGREVYVPSGVKFLRSQNVWDDGLRLDSVAFIKPTTHAKMAGTVVAANDLLFNITGASIGRCAVVPSDFDEANVSQHVTIVRTVLPALNAFLHKVLVSRHVQQAVMDVQVGVSREGLSIAKLGQFLIPVPPLAEQSRIVTRVEELMRLCDALETKGQLEATQHAQLICTLLATLTDRETPALLADNWHRIATHFDLLLDRPEAVDALDQTILQLAVRGLLVPQDPQDEPASVLLKEIRAEKDKLLAEGKIKRDKPLPPIAEEEEPFALPQGWEWARVADLCSMVTDGEHLTPTRCDDATQVPLVTAKNVRHEVMDYRVTDYVPQDVAKKCWQRCKPLVGDILMVSVGATLGRLCVLREPLDMVLVRSVTVLRPVHVGVYVDFFALHLMSQNSQNEIWREVKQSAQPCLYLAKSAALKIALPPLAEQSRIVTRVAQLRRLCADLRQRLSARQSTQAHLAEALVADISA